MEEIGGRGGEGRGALNGCLVGQWDIEGRLGGRMDGGTKERCKILKTHKRSKGMTIMRVCMGQGARYIGRDAVKQMDSYSQSESHEHAYLRIDLDEADRSSS